MSNPRGGWDKVCLETVGDTLYAHLSLLPQALDYVRHHNISTLVTEGGDLCLHEVGDRIVVSNANIEFVACEVAKNKIPPIKWLSSNNNTTLDIETFPLGLFKTPLDFTDESYFDRFKNKPRKNQFLINCDERNNLPVRRPLKIRARNNPNIVITSYAGQTSNDTLLSIWEEISDYKYLICPVSNGFDTCRIWEALHLGTIPVLDRKFPYYRNIAKQYPVMLVDELESVTC